MTPRQSARQEPCGRVEATSRLAQACCARLQTRAGGQDQKGAAALVATISPHGPAIAKDLRRLLDRKDTVHHGTTMITPAEGARMVGWAARLVGHAHAAVEA